MTGSNTNIDTDTTTNTWYVNQNAFNGAVEPASFQTQHRQNPRPQQIDNLDRNQCVLIKTLFQL